MRGRCSRIRIILYERADFRDRAWEGRYLGETMRSKIRSGQIRNYPFHQPLTKSNDTRAKDAHNNKDIYAFNQAYQQGDDQLPVRSTTTFRYKQLNPLNI